MDDLPSKRPRGFAALTPEQRIAVSRKGGSAVNAQDRAFSRDAHLARSAGEKGGKLVPADKRTFSRDRTLAQLAGKKSRRKQRDSAEPQ